MVKNKIFISVFFSPGLHHDYKDIMFSTPWQLIHWKKQKKTEAIWRHSFPTLRGSWLPPFPKRPQPLRTKTRALFFPPKEAKLSSQSVCDTRKEKKKRTNEHPRVSGLPPTRTVAQPSQCSQWSRRGRRVQREQSLYVCVWLGGCWWSGMEVVVKGNGMDWRKLG